MDHVPIAIERQEAKARVRVGRKSVIVFVREFGVTHVRRHTDVILGSHARVGGDVAQLILQIRVQLVQPRVVGWQVGGSVRRYARPTGYGSAIFGDPTRQGLPAGAGFPLPEKEGQKAEQLVVPVEGPGFDGRVVILQESPHPA